MESREQLVQRRIRHPLLRVKLLLLLLLLPPVLAQRRRRWVDMERRN
jgi:hypothetical protein